MNVEIGTEDAQFLSWEYINGIFIEVQGPAVPYCTELAKTIVTLPCILQQCHMGTVILVKTVRDSVSF